MTTLPILKYPHPLLRQQCLDIKVVDDTVRALASNMVDAMRLSKGIGLAAPQVGQAVRLLVAQVEEDAPLVQLANPRLLQTSGEVLWEEGCLSLPGICAEVRRASEVTVCGLDMEGKEITVEASELLAVCLQHEIDHLNGVLFFDHLSHLKRHRLLARYKKQQLSAANEK